jgi:hypothetical protein
MLRRSGVVVFKAARGLFANWRALAIMIAVYALLLITLYLLLTTKEATTVQVSNTLALAFVAPLLFFLLQSIGAASADVKTARGLLIDSFQKGWKLFVVSIPVLASVVLTAYLLNKIQTHTGISASEPAGPVGTLAQTQTPKPPIQFTALAIMTARYLLLGILAPLALIHLWISTNQNGLIATFRGILAHLARAFAPQSVLIYIAGFVIFAVVPYVILFKTTSTSRAWLEIGLLSVRLIAVFLMTLLGWVLTVRALSLTTEPKELAASGNA